MPVIRLLALILTLAAPLAATAQHAQLRQAWPETDFTRVAVDFAEVLSGGVPRDAIPALTDPAMIPVAQSDLPRDEPVITLELEDAAPRAYPLRYLTWHEIVNDTVAGRPIAVTFCPLCNSALAFEREVAGQVLEFGVSGLLRHSDIIMYDRNTHSWWQQFTGEAIVGEMTGRRLDLVVSWMEPVSTFAARNPEGLVMAEPGAARPYGVNPYAGYDSAPRPFLYSGDPPPHGIEPLARVLRVGERAWPLSRLQDGTVRESGLEITWAPGMASALDGEFIAGSRDVGHIRVRDAQGRDVVHEVVFAFAFHAFHPNGTWMLGE